MANQPDRKIALAFMAHPDDAEILCAGTLIRLADAGWEVHIATATPGDCGTISQTPWAISAQRTAEAAQAAALIHARYHCLDERDAMVVYDKPTLRKVIDLFRVVSPSLVFAHAPKDYMMDHEITSLLARAASFAYAAPNVSTLPVREGAGVPYLYYCDPLEGTDPLGSPVAPTTRIDIASELERKRQMLAAHASQREWLLAYHGVDEYLDAMQRHAAMRGRETGTAAAEAFVQHRGHAYPKDDILARLFGSSPEHG
jgi:LmbE family N-acetylglucosaminyl deacetylase